MLDIRLIRERPDFVRERLATRSAELVQQIDDVLKIDAERRRLETEVQQLNAGRNKLSKEIGILRSKKESSAEQEAKVRAKCGFCRRQEAAAIPGVELCKSVWRRKLASPACCGGDRGFAHLFAYP